MKQAKKLKVFGLMTMLISMVFMVSSCSDDDTGGGALSMQHIYIIDYQRPFILIGTTSVLTNTQNVGTNANRCISWYCIYVLYRLFSVLLWNVRYQIQCVE